jgi:hypothetical protein
VCYDGDATPVPMIFIWEFYKRNNWIRNERVGKKNYFLWIDILDRSIGVWIKSILLQHFLTGRKFFVWLLLRRNPKKVTIENRILLYRFKSMFL